MKARRTPRQVNAALLERGHAHATGLLLHSLVFEATYYSSFRSLLAFSSRALGLAPPWQVELGIVSIKGLNRHLVTSEDDGRASLIFRT